MADMNSNENIKFDKFKHIKEIKFKYIEVIQTFSPVLIKFQDWKDIPNFSIITGRNGSGKSQILSYINKSIYNKNNDLEIKSVFLLH